MKRNLLFSAMLSLPLLVAAQHQVITKTGVAISDQPYISNVWNPDLGNGMYKNPVINADYSDPDVVCVGDDYYLTASSFNCIPGLPILHSKDLVNWELIGHAVTKLQPESEFDKPSHGNGVWAPCISYHKGEFYIYWGDPDYGVFMVKTKNPAGKWEDPVCVIPGKGMIDTSPLWDEDGRVYLVNGWANSRNRFASVITVRELNAEGTKAVSDPVIVFDGNGTEYRTCEGPKFYKRNGWYYIFAPAGGVKPGWQTVLRSRNIFGPYEYRVVMRQGDTPVNGPHQGAWVDTVTGEDWFLHFQDVYAAGRIIHLQPMSWKEDWPIIGVAKDGNEYGEPVLTYRKPNVGEAAKEVTICEPDASDDFTKKTLGLQWQWNANPKKEWCELTGNGLRLNAVREEKGLPYGDYPNLLLQKWPAPEFTCETTLSLAGLKLGA